MNWTALLRSQIEGVYHATDGLVKMVEPGMLSWKPATGSNWMTVGQLLEHTTNACGTCIRNFVTGEWGMPEGATEGDMLPSADKMPTAKSVADVLKRLEAEKKLALDSVAKAGEEDLANKKVPAPWNPTPQVLGEQMLFMVEHLQTHKAQLFYYLKLLGKPVHTGHMYGM